MDEDNKWENELSYHDREERNQRWLKWGSVIFSLTICIGMTYLVLKKDREDNLTMYTKYMEQQKASFTNKSAHREKITILNGTLLAGSPQDNFNDIVEKFVNEAKAAVNQELELKNLTFDVIVKGSQIGMYNGDLIRENNPLVHWYAAVSYVNSGNELKNKLLMEKRFGKHNTGFHKRIDEIILDFKDLTENVDHLTDGDIYTKMGSIYEEFNFLYNEIEIKLPHYDQPIHGKKELTQKFIEQRQDTLDDLVQKGPGTYNLDDDPEFIAMLE